MAALKYSILIVCYKDYTSLNKCVELIRKREAQDYEIIMHDNSPEALRHNVGAVSFGEGDGIGFAAGVNQCAKLAKGEILVFLNPDTEPTGDWLDRMAKGFERDEKFDYRWADRYDYIGCTSDYIAGIQSYARYMDEPREFVDTKLIIPVCAMIRKSTFEEMGGFDERFFLGCEDLDFSWRMNLAGKRMGICTDVFIHHVGHTGFELTPNKKQIIDDMETKIRAKLKDYYGDSVPSSEELWGCKILATELRPQTLSICMIHRNAYKDLQRLLPMLKFADEIVLCETDPDGGRDKIAQRLLDSGNYNSTDVAFKFKFVKFPWIDDFSAARNFALSKCVCDWVLWLDADDRITSENAALIRAAMDKPGNLTALRACHFAFKIKNTGSNHAFPQSRLFPNLPSVKWGGAWGTTGRIHETYYESLEKLGLLEVFTSIEIEHTGYADEKVNKAKQERNIRLLNLEPDVAIKFYHLASSYVVIEDYEKAEEACRRGLGLECEGVVRENLRHLMALILSRVGRWDEMREFTEGNTKPDAMYFHGLAAWKAGDEFTAMKCFFQYLAYKTVNDPFGSNYSLLRVNAAEHLKTMGILP